LNVIDAARYSEADRRAVAKALMRYRHMVPSLHALHEATNVFDSATQALMEKSATDI
jgi:hypothetical protein